jgi:hypothetical protein
VPDVVPDGGQMGGQSCQTGQAGCPTGLEGVPDGSQTGWRTEGLFTFKRKKRHVLYTCLVNHRQHPTCPTPGGCKKNSQ